VRIPKGQEVALGRLFRLPEGELSALVNALEKLSPSVSLDHLAKRAAAAANRNPADTYELFSLISTLHAVWDLGDEQTQEEFVESVCAAARDSGNAELQPPDGGWEPIKRRLSKLLAVKSLRASAKALNIFLENERLYCRGRILTDLRPIFLAGENVPPSAAVIMHSLRISYHQDGKLRSFFVALESEDARQMKRQLDRALAKEESLRHAAKEGGITCLRFKPE